MKTLTPSQEEIAVRAYHLYLNDGCQHGRDWEYWFRAEQDLGAKFFTPPVADAPAAKKTEKKAVAATAKKSSAPAPAKKTPAKKEAAKKAATKKKAE